MKIFAKLFLVLIASVVFLNSSTSSFAVSPSSAKADNERGQVVNAQNVVTKSPTGIEVKTEELQVKVLSGPDKNKTVKVIYDPQGLSSLNLSAGDSVILTKQTDSRGTNYSINDRFRLPEVAAVLIGFLILILLIAGKKGIGSVIGLGISLAVIFVFVVPAILSGQNPLTICLIGAFAILFLTTYIAHGFSRQTTIAMFSTFVALLLTWVIATLVTDVSLLSGYGTEEAYDLHLGLKSLVDFQGLFLGGIIIATLGALNDVTTTQAATIFEIHKADPKLNFDQLLKRGMSVGREHVVSLVNTLVLAFVGTSLALFLIFFFNPTGQSIWVILNSEVISEEIIKTVAGTSGLLLAMPIVTILAAFICVDIIGDKHK